jgi:hypothetical protein
VNFRQAKRIAIAPVKWANRAKTGKGRLLRWWLVLSLYYSPVSITKSIFSPASKPADAQPTVQASSAVSDKGQLFLATTDTGTLEGYSGEVIVWSVVQDRGTSQLRHTTVKKPNGTYLLSIDCNTAKQEGSLYVGNKTYPVGCKLDRNQPGSDLATLSVVTPQGTAFNGIGIVFDPRESAAEIQAAKDAAN